MNISISSGIISMQPLLSSANGKSFSFYPSSTKPSIPLKSPVIIWPHSKELRWSGVAKFSKDLKEVANDDKHINKEVVALNPQLYDYILANVREPQILRELREETSRMSGSQMQGYSSLAVALVLPELGHLVACERDANCLAVAKKYYQRAGVLDKVELRHGLAIDTLHDLLNHGEVNNMILPLLMLRNKCMVNTMSCFCNWCSCADYSLLLWLSFLLANCDESISCIPSTHVILLGQEVL